MNLLHDLTLHVRDHGDRVHLVVEVPRGSTVKLKYDDERGVFMWSRALSLGVSFPFDFGFLPQTLADDGDALDGISMSMMPSYPGVVVSARAVGTLRVEQKRGDQPVKRNDRLLLVPVNAHRYRHIQDIHDVPQRVRDEIEAFCQASLLLTGKHVTFRGWADARETMSLIDAAHTRYRTRRTP